MLGVMGALEDGDELGFVATLGLIVGAIGGYAAGDLLTYYYRYYPYFEKRMASVRYNRERSVIDDVKIYVEQLKAGSTSVESLQASLARLPENKKRLLEAHDIMNLVVNALQIRQGNQGTGQRNETLYKECIDLRTIIKHLLYELSRFEPKPQSVTPPTQKIAAREIPVLIPAQ